MSRGPETLAIREPIGSVFFFAFAVFLLLSPLYKAGNRPLPLLLLELAAIAFLFVIVAMRRAPLGLPRGVIAAIGVLLVYPLAQLIPLPDGVWRALPGHAEYVEVLDRFAANGGAHAWRAISVVPAATEYGWLALLPPLACLLVTLHLSTTRVVRLLLLMALLAGAEAVLGLLQVGPSGGGILYFGNEEPGQYVAIGTFVNRNHVAALLAMTLPVIVGLLVLHPRSLRRDQGRTAMAPPSEVMAKRTLLFALAVIILVCLFFTRSRAGIATGLLGLACSALVLARARNASADPPRARFTGYAVIGLIVISIGIAVAFGIGPLLKGLETSRLQASADFRWAIYAATLRGAAEFLPFGSGLSTYAEVFPRFQVADVGGFIDYAHNDYLQAWMELGVAAPVVVLLFFVAWLTRLIGLLRSQAARSFTLLQLAAGLGMVPIMLHSMFDFALHMPANAMWFATLAGVMFHPGVEARSLPPGRHRRHDRHTAETSNLLPGVAEQGQPER